MSARSFWIAAPKMVVLPLSTLKPLSSGGLWLPVICTPPSQSRWKGAKYKTGVATSPTSMMCSGVASRPSQSAACRTGAGQHGPDRSAQVAGEAIGQIAVGDAADVVFAKHTGVGDAGRGHGSSEG